MSDDLTAIKVSLARVEERQEASVHRMRNIDVKLDVIANQLTKFVDKDELDETLLTLRNDMAEVKKTQNIIVRSCVAGAAAVTGGLYAFGKKIGIV